MLTYADVCWRVHAEDVCKVGDWGCACKDNMCPAIEKLIGIHSLSYNKYNVYWAHAHRNFHYPIINIMYIGHTLIGILTMEGLKNII